MNSPPNHNRPPGELPGGHGARAIDVVNASLKRRYAAERRFRLAGAGAVLLGLGFVAMLFISIVSQGYTAFLQTYIQLPVYFAADVVDPQGDLVRDHAQGDLTRGEIDRRLLGVNFLSLGRAALKAEFPGVSGRADTRALNGLLSPGAPLQLREMLARDPSLVGSEQSLWLLADDDVDMFMKGRSTPVRRLGVSGTASLGGPNGVGLLGDPPTVGARVRVHSTAADFAPLLASVQEFLGREPHHGERGADGVELTDEMPSFLIQLNGGMIKATSVSGSEIEGVVYLPPDSIEPARAKDWRVVELLTPETDRRLKDRQVTWILHFQQAAQIEKRFNTSFFSNGTSREPELAGIAGAVMGSFYTLVLTLLFSFPIGVGAAVYLEEFAPKNRLTDLIEVNINNLAAVPSIVFGLLGLAVFINFFGVPRSTPLVAAMVLTLMTLPTIIIASRAALKSVPPSIREAALGVGASPLQTQIHHVLPLALPGMLTGTIIGMAQALGESAPLLMIGMIAFIVDIPGGFTDPATVLPVQIFLWADSPERGFVERTSAAIMVLLAFLVLMNLAAVLLRRRFERRW